MLPIVIVLLVILGLQVWNRHGKGKKVAPAQVFQAHMGAGLLFLVVFFVHGLPHLLRGWAPFPNELTGILIAVSLVGAVIFGILTKRAKGMRRKQLAIGHKTFAAVALVFLLGHLYLALA